MRQLEAAVSSDGPWLMYCDTQEDGVYKDPTKTPQIFNNLRDFEAHVEKHHLVSGLWAAARAGAGRDGRRQLRPGRVLFKAACALPV